MLARIRPTQLGLWSFAVAMARARSSLCAQQTCFAERAFQKIVLQRQLSDLGMQRRAA
jgi:hypothetical protein